MENTVLKSIIAGIVGTAIMTVVTMIAPYMGLPEMSPPNMLASMLDTSVAVGWIMHFMIGIIFALAYTYLFAPNVAVGNIWVKGLIFGIAAFVFAQIMMQVMGAMMAMPPMEGSMVMRMIGSLIGHIVFGMAVARVVGEPIVART